MDFAYSLIERGAVKVYYPTKPISENNAKELLNKIIVSGVIPVKLLEELGFRSLP